MGSEKNLFDARRKPLRRDATDLQDIRHSHQICQRFCWHFSDDVATRSFDGPRADTELSGNLLIPEAGSTKAITSCSRCVRVSNLTLRSATAFSLSYLTRWIACYLSICVCRSRRHRNSQPSNGLDVVCVPICDAAGSGRQGGATINQEVVCIGRETHSVKEPCFRPR